MTDYLGQSKPNGLETNKNIRLAQLLFSKPAQTAGLKIIINHAYV